MSSTEDLLCEVLDRAILEIEAKAIPIFTFAFYHDHESAAVSVCADTADNSRRFVRQSNVYSQKRFETAVEEGNLKSAELWQANIGRSLSLGDFSLVNVARTDIAENAGSIEFYLAMIRAVVERHHQIEALSPDSGGLILACSGPSDEVQYVWSLGEVAES